MRTFSGLFAFWAAIATLVVNADDPKPNSTPSPATAARANIDAAMGEYQQRISDIETRLAAQIDELIDKYAARGDLDQVLELQNQKRIFLEQGTLPDQPVYNSMRRQARIELTRATGPLDDAYEQAIDALTKARDFKSAERIKNEWEQVKATRSADGPNSLEEIRKNPRRPQQPPRMPTPAPDPSPTGITNSIGMQLRLIPAGEFQRVDFGAAHGSLDGPSTRITITKPFFIGVYEVTNDQWMRVMGSVPSFHRNGKTLPVEQVTFALANQFCQRLSSLGPESQARRHYRLPTEAEWEYACRAGTDTMFCSGNDTHLLKEYAWFADNSGNRHIDASTLFKDNDASTYTEKIRAAGCRTHPVGQKKPNRWGLCDMHGNVNEWTLDVFRPYDQLDKVDPRAEADDKFGIVRGGGFELPSNFCRSGNRHNQSRDYVAFSFGLRVVMTLSE